MKESDNPGYIQFQLPTENSDVQKPNKLIRDIIRANDRKGRNNLFSACELAGRFLGILQQCLAELQEEARKRDVSELSGEEKWKLEQLQHIRDRIRLRRHGPAIQMDVYTDADRSSKLHSVDMVPTMQIGEDKYYVPKPVKEKKSAEKQASGSRVQKEWRQSFSLKEKERLSTADRENGCRKQVLRVLKATRMHKPELAWLSSFHYKTALFRVMDQHTNDEAWKGEHLGERLMNVFEQIEMELGRGDMPNYFLPEVNLLDGVQEQTISNTRCRLQKLIGSKKNMRQLLESVRTRCACES